MSAVWRGAASSPPVPRASRARIAAAAGTVAALALAAACSDGTTSSSPSTRDRATTSPTTEAPSASGSPTTVAPTDGAEVPRELASTIEAIVAEPQYQASTWGVAVRDVETGEVLVDRAGDTMFVTGSILRMLSAAGVLQALGPDYRFVTPVHRVGEVAGGVLTGNLVLVAAGDFSFGLRDQPDGTLQYASLPVLDHNAGAPGAGLVGSNPSAALDALATQVRAAGITTVNGEVIIDDRSFETYRGWPDGVIAPIWFNENVIDVIVTPGASVDTTATVDWRPRTAAFTVESAVTTTAPEAASEPLTITPERERPNVLTVRGQIGVGAPAQVRIHPVPDPAAWARTGFIEALARAGVGVTAPATGLNPSDQLPAPNRYEAATKVAEYASAPLSEYVAVVSKVGYNRGADLFVCLTAIANRQASCPAGMVPIVDTARALGIPDGTTYPFDGAGSDERDRTTPLAITAFLQGAPTTPWFPAFEAGLPVLGADGTRRAITGTRAGFTAAGQGLLTGMSQVGYVDTAGGRRFGYAIMVRDVPLRIATDLVAVEEDQAAIAAAIQAGY